MAYSNVPGTTVPGYPLSSSYNSGWSYSTTAEIRFIRPIFYGFSGTSSVVSLNPTTTNVLSTFRTKLTTLQNTKLTKLIKPYPGINSSLLLSVSGTGRIYFSYPRANGIGDVLNESSLLTIKDPNGFVLYQKGNPTASAFYPASFDMNSQSGWTDHVLWVSKFPCSYPATGFFELTFGTSSTFNWPVIALDGNKGLMGPLI
jgi:hypothetical protein